VNGNDNSDHSMRPRRLRPLYQKPVERLEVFASGIFKIPIHCAAHSVAQQLLAEMANMTSAEELSGWAHRSLPAKNKLTSADAQLVERAFESKLNAVPGDEEPATESTVLNSTRSDAAGMSATAI
jgi:hypothetical protein